MGYPDCVSDQALSSDMKHCFFWQDIDCPTVEVIQEVKTGFGPWSSRVCGHGGLSIEQCSTAFPCKILIVQLATLEILPPPGDDIQTDVKEMCEKRKNECEQNTGI